MVILPRYHLRIAQQEKHFTNLIKIIMENTTLIKACPNCGSNSFLLTESISYKGSINENGELDLYKNLDDSINEIVCADCGESFTEDDFSAINF